MIKKWKQIIIVLFILILIGCRPWSAIEITEGRGFPAVPDFSIHPKGDYKKTGIDFNAIYYIEFESLRDREIEQVSYNYYRFWPNGRVLINSSDYIPTSEKAEDFVNAYVGFYQVEENKIVMEFFVPDSGAMNWSYICSYGVIEKDRIIINRSRMRNRNEDEPGRKMIFTKINFSKLKRQSDW